MDFLSILEKFVEQVAGKDAVKLLILMRERENISEFVLAEDLKLNVNQVRNLLYKLNSFNLTYSTRRKDKDKGLYIYYWTFNFKHARDLLTVRKKQELEHSQDELKKENDQRFYVCKNGCTRVELEEAMELGFKCQECGSLLQQGDNTKKVGEINHRIQTLIQELEELKKPVTIVPKPEEEIKVKKIKKPRKGKKVKSKKAKKKSKKKIKGKVKAKKHIKKHATKKKAKKHSAKKVKKVKKRKK